MTKTQRICHKQIAAAEAWAVSCHAMLQAAEYQLRAAGEYHEVGQRRMALRAAEARYRDALEDATGWRKLARKIR